MPIPAAAIAMIAIVIVMVVWVATGQQQKQHQDKEAHTPSKRPLERPPPEQFREEPGRGGQPHQESDCRDDKPQGGTRVVTLAHPHLPHRYGRTVATS